MLALLDGDADLRDAALKAASLFGSTPRAEFTVLAPADVAAPSAPTANGNGTASPNGNGLVQLSRQTSTLVETVRLIEGRGFPTRLRTTEGQLLPEAERIAPAHDVVVLPRCMAHEADRFTAPVLVV